MKTLALTSTVFVLSAVGVMAQQSDIEFLRARADAHERKISQLERELNQLKLDYAQQQRQPKSFAPAEAETSGKYVVKNGDTLGRIAKRFDVSLAALKLANGLRSDNIRIGQKLVIPGSKPVSSVAKSTKPVPPAATSGAKPLRTESTHKVTQGETFYSIARKHKVSLASLKAANPSVSPSRLQVGETLKIDPSARTTTSSAVAKSTTRSVKSTRKSKPATKIAEHIDPPKPKPTRTKEVTRRAPADSKPITFGQPEIRTVTVHKQISYGQFASQYGANTNQLNELNGLSLSKNTMLAVGSELYVPRD